MDARRSNLIASSSFDSSSPKALTTMLNNLKEDANALPTCGYSSNTTSIFSKNSSPSLSISLKVVVVNAFLESDLFSSMCDHSHFIFSSALGTAASLTRPICVSWQPAFRPSQTEALLQPYSSVYSDLQSRRYSFRRGGGYCKSKHQCGSRKELHRCLGKFLDVLILQLKWSIGLIG